MPLYEYQCSDCSHEFERLVSGNASEPNCERCGSQNVKRLLSAHASISGEARSRLPGMGDTGCCGSSPHQASCAGPGSCCGKNHS